MSPVAEVSSPDLEQWLASEIRNARGEARPISRLTLTKMAITKYGLKPHEAERLIDAYCDEKEPSVPTMLSDEFGVPYLKVLAVLNVGISLGFFYMAMRIQNSIWFGLLFGTAFLGGAVFCWVRSLAPVEGKRARA